MFSEIHCVVRGRVQGVGYRDFIEEATRRYGVYGWIKNKDDGSVEVVLQGLPEVLKQCIEVLNEGSSLAKVDSLSVDWRTPEKQFEEFRVISS